MQKSVLRQLSWFCFNFHEFYPFPNPAPYFFLWSLGSTVRMLLCGWPSYGCPRKIFLFLTFSFKQWGCQCWKHKFRSIALGVCLLVSRFVYQKSSWKIMELNAFLGGGSSMWVFLFTLPPVSAWVVLLSVSSSSLAHSQWHLSCYSGASRFCFSF